MTAGARGATPVATAAAVTPVPWRTPELARVLVTAHGVLAGLSLHRLLGWWILPAAAAGAIGGTVSAVVAARRVSVFRAVVLPVLLLAAAMVALSVPAMASADEGTGAAQRLVDALLAGWGALVAEDPQRTASTAVPALVLAWVTAFLGRSLLVPAGARDVPGTVTGRWPAGGAAAVPGVIGVAVGAALGAAGSGPVALVPAASLGVGASLAALGTPSPAGAVRRLAPAALVAVLAALAAPLVPLLVDRPPVDLRRAGAPATTVPATTVPATTVPATTVPATTVPATVPPAVPDGTVPPVVPDGTVVGSAPVTSPAGRPDPGPGGGGRWPAALVAVAPVLLAVVAVVAVRPVRRVRRHRRRPPAARTLGAWEEALDHLHVLGVRAPAGATATAVATPHGLASLAHLADAAAFGGEGVAMADRAWEELRQWEAELPAPTRWRVRLDPRACRRRW